MVVVIVTHVILKAVVLVEVVVFVATVVLKLDNIPNKDEMHHVAILYVCGLTMYVTCGAVYLLCLVAIRKNVIE